MARRFFKDALGWGFGLWLLGYGLGIMLFALVPLGLIGWVILPIGTAAAVWVLIKRVKAESLAYYFLLSLTWTAIAVVFDYFFLVKAFKPADGYYKLDVYLYYAITFALPMVVGKLKRR